MDDTEHKRAVTLAQVAVRAGVSKITASRALSATSALNVRADTVAKIQKAARDLGYRPNLLARSLTGPHSGMVAILVPDLENAVFAELVTGIQEGLEGTGLQTIVTRIGFDPQAELRAVQAIAGWKPVAFVLAGPGRLDETAVFLKQTGIRTIETMELPREPIDIAVGHDHQIAGELAADHLHERGYRRMAVLTANANDLRALRRADGFIARLATLGATVPMVLDDVGPTSFDLGKQLCRRLLADHPEVDAVFAINDTLAIGAAMHCIDASISVPGQLAICGFNDLPIARALGSGITTVRSPRLEIGRATGEILRVLGEGGTCDALLEIPCTLIVRGSS